MPTPLLRAAVNRTAAKLPDPFPGLAARRVAFRRNELVMWAGPPGAGKTMTALIAAIRMGVPTLYFSADSDERTMAVRAAAAVSKHPGTTVEETVRRGLFGEYYGQILQDLQTWFVFESEPGMDDITNNLAAWLELYGEPPHLIVVDNLINMRSDEGNEWTGLRQTCKNLHWLARKSGACVLVLHHTSEQDPKAITSAPPRPAIQGKVAQLPALILTSAIDSEGVMWVAPVKNRHGPSDPMALNPLRWIADFARCQILDQPLELSVTEYHKTIEEDEC